MKRHNHISLPRWLMFALCLSVLTFPPAQASQRSLDPKLPLSPIALIASQDGQALYIACATSASIAVFDTQTAQVVRTINLPIAPSGLALDTTGTQLFVTAGDAAGQVLALNLKSGKIIKSIPVGHTPMSPVVSPDGRRLWVCNRFNHAVGVVDLTAGREIARLPVAREPVAAALTANGAHLLVANHLPNGRSDADYVSANISVIDLAAGRVTAELILPNGSSQLRDIRVSPDGLWAAATHLMARYHLPTTQLDRGWMNANALSLIDLTQLNVLNTVLLDHVDRGAANPWAIAWTADSRQICVTHAGTHEMSVIETPALIQKLRQMPLQLDSRPATAYQSASRIASDVPNDLSFLVGISRRIPLSGRGPRAVLTIGNIAYVAHYFSDSLSLVDLANPAAQAKTVTLQPPITPSLARQGEALFNDATICFQGWQSCSSCHSADARVDGFNWDLLNDGLGNPKNSKSLLLSHRTPPAMSMSVRDTAEMAVRAGIQHILFTVQPEPVAAAIDEYLKSLKPGISPFLENKRLSPAARRGQILFRDAKTGCSHCHPPELYTDLQHHDVGTRGRFDQPNDQFDTPTLIELWRTAPYLHDGSAVSLREVLTQRNPNDSHGRTSELTSSQVDDLVAYLLSQ